ncbi:hypothetical protein B0H16DRAFT_1455764 [Mycena metata]|uniref:Uncharacterized protein n=1 Tax=Mycena metata TaxID=1033252 RepID=A0AAD7JCR4_9AGAR|nr:hypothetical protein B0H16DRAFT_1455764 [Mycena metata]
MGSTLRVRIGLLSKPVVNFFLDIRMKSHFIPLGNCPRSHGEVNRTKNRRQYAENFFVVKSTSQAVKMLTLYADVVHGALLESAQRKEAAGPKESAQNSRTAIWLAEQLTDAKFDFTVEGSGHTIIRCKGIG